MVVKYYLIYFFISLLHFNSFSKEVVPKEAIKAAEKGLIRYMKGIGKEYKPFGYKSEECFLNSRIGPPVIQYKIYDDTIFNYNKYQDVNFMVPIMPSGIWRFPVLCGDTAVVWLDVYYEKGKYSAGAFGGVTVYRTYNLIKLFPDSKGYSIQYVRLYDFFEFLIIKRKGNNIKIKPTGSADAYLGLKYYVDKFYTPEKIIPIISEKIKERIEAGSKMKGKAKKVGK